MNRAGKAALAALLASSGAPWAAMAQEDVRDLATLCAASDPTSLQAPCLETVLAARAAQGLIGLAASGGTEMPGGSSTLGKRFGGTPRIGLTAAVVVAAGDLAGGLAPATGNAPSEGTRLTALQATAAAGIFQGFSPAPTMGGILSLDLLATLAWVGLPEGRGFTGSTTSAGMGVRVGVFRESFTLPGVTLSAVKRWVGDASLVDGERGRVDLDATVTSLRLTAGKELLAFGLLGGVGWDRYGGDVDLDVRPSGPTGPAGSVREDSFTADRLLFFLGAGYTFLVAQVAVEGGWAKGFEAVPARAASGYDPTGGSLFGRLSFRLTL